MSEYDYLNARIRGMSADLLDNELLEQILAADGDEIIIDVLMNSSYKGALAEAQTAHHGIAAAEIALRNNLFETLNKVRTIAPPGAKKLVTIQLNKWDVANVVTLLRGISAGKSADDIARSLLPAGEYRPVQLAELASEPDIRSLADALTTWGYELASVLGRAIASQGPEINLQAVETDLYIEYFRWAFSLLDDGDPNEALLVTLLRFQVDLINVLSILKSVEYRSSSVTAPLPLIPGGSIPSRQMAELQNAGSASEALEILEETAFASGVERGVLAFGETNRVSAIERFLEATLISRAIGLYRGDILTAAVPLGFIWRKINEYLNVRMAIRGKQYRVPANAIREAMVFA